MTHEQMAMYAASRGHVMYIYRHGKTLKFARTRPNRPPYVAVTTHDTKDTILERTKRMVAY